MKASKEKVYSFIQGTLTDVSLAEYQVQWQRISQMQQNASILLAAITFSYLSLFSILTFEIKGKNILDIRKWSKIIKPSLITGIVIGALSIFWLLKVIYPKIIKKGFPKINEFRKEIIIKVENNLFKNEDYEKDEVEIEVSPPRYISHLITKKMSESISEMDDLIESNQNSYEKGLICAILNIIVTICSYFLIIFRLTLKGANLYFMNLVINTWGVLSFI